MNYKAIVIVGLVIIAAVALIRLPEEKRYDEIASVGSAAPDFELYDADGKLWKLSDQRGKVIFINFWATWCTVCKSELPLKESLYEKMQGKPFQMFGILYRDNPRSLKPYFQKYKVSFPTLINNDDAVSRAFGITGVPETFIIDKEGIVREKVVGPGEWDDPEIIAFIEKWL